MDDIIRVQGRMTMGYGIIPKMVMHDKRLTIEAKAIYAYFCSYAGNGTTSFPSRDKIIKDLQIGENRYYKHFNLLKQYGYIEVSQNIDNLGKFKNNIYTLIEMIEPYPQNEYTDKEPCLHYPCTENEGINNNNINNNIKDSYISNPILSYQSESFNSEENDMIRCDKTNNQLPVDNSVDKVVDKNNPKKLASTNPKHGQVEECIKKQVNYNYLLKDKGVRKSMLDEIIFVIVSTICTEYKNGYISMGEELIPAETVRNVFYKLSSEHIEYFIECFNRQTEIITKLSPYIRKSLYYNYGTVKHYYTNRVHHDIPQLAEQKI